MNKEFQMAIAITTNSFKVAVDGRHLLTYDFKTIFKSSVRRLYNNQDPIFESLTGFKIFAENGMRLFVSRVSHFHLEDDCAMYENFTHPSYA